VLVVGAENGVEIGVRLERRHHSADSAGSDRYVGIDEEEDLASGLSSATISGAGGAGILREAEHFRP